LEKLIVNKIIQGVWVNEYASLVKNNVIISVLLFDPETNEKFNYSLEFNAQGKFYITDELNQKYS